MKIAIYGDSYGCINTKWDGGVVGPGLSWVDRLEYSHDIVNFSKSGTAFMYSYEKFLEENQKFDLNIFAVTSPHRVYIKALDGQSLIFGPDFIDLQIKRIKGLPLYPKQHDHIEILKSAKVHVDLWADWKMITHIQSILVKNISVMRPNTLLLPGFLDSFENAKFGLYPLMLHELMLVDAKKSKTIDWSDLQCHRKCHFSSENNLVLFNKIDAAIKLGKTSIEIDESDIVKPIGSFDSFVTLHNRK